MEADRRARDVTDTTNASRTLLCALDTLDWDEKLLALFEVDRALLPRIARSSETVGEAQLLGASLPIAGLAGDQQAALFGQGCLVPAGLRRQMARLEGAPPLTADIVRLRERIAGAGIN